MKKCCHHSQKAFTEHLTLSQAQYKVLPVLSHLVTMTSLLFKRYYCAKITDETWKPHMLKTDKERGDFLVANAVTPVWGGYTDRYHGSNELSPFRIRYS